MRKIRIGDRYTLVRRISAGDIARGVPELWHAQDAGDFYYAKVWKRRGEDLIDMRALWNREVRSLTRLQGYPGASELFIRLHDLRVDDSYFCAILDGGRRLPLSEVLRNRNQSPWLLNLSEVGRRRLLWEGLLRIAEAITVLHNEGTLHRSLSPASIFVSPEGQGDFRLSGFEWSLRVAGPDASAAKIDRATVLMAPELEKTEGEFSTATDWFDFGLIAAELFGAPVRNTKKREALRSAVDSMQALREGERDLIIRLLAESSEQRLSGSDEILREIRNLLRDLAVVTAGLGRGLVLAVRLGPDINLSRAIELASERNAPAHQPILQRRWIENDLRGDPRITARTLPQPHFVIRGEKLEYRVRPWHVESLETWDVGYCESVESIPRTAAEDQHFSLGQRRLEITSYPDVRRALRTIRDRSAPWDKTFSFSRTRHQLDPHLRDIHDFFRITQQLDTVLTVARICPVDILYVERNQNDTLITVTPREEAERNTLTQHLHLPRPSEQLRDWFNLGAEAISADDEDDPAHDTYQLLNRRTVDSEGPTAEWRFVGASPDTAGPRYKFRCIGSIPVREGLAYLARNHGGTIAQIKRRHKAIEEMRTHENLLRLLNDPYSASRASSNVIPPSRAAIQLDDSKMKALVRLWQTQPSFATQGPPGTGKTTLIKAFADRLLSADPTAQILVTAHSHHTVDDVRRKLSDLFSGLPPSKCPILLRLGARDASVHDIGPVTESILRRLQSSELAKRSPAFLQERLSAVLPSDDGHDEVSDVDLRTMQMLVQDAANVTFATLNSFDLAELSERGRRFDWSIIEEAGKAHGFDMAIALEESHQLLLIGDHFQLPPYNSRVFKDLLGDPLRVKKAIQAGVKFAASLVDPAIVDEEEGREPFNDRCDRWRRMVDLFANFFRNSIGDSLLQDGPAVTLTDQHRMHPHIAELVGNVFYPREAGGTIINSPRETHDRFAASPPFYISAESWLPDHRIVWCDVPWTQRKEFAEGEVDGLFESPAETRAVVATLAEIYPREGHSCEIQILSPYNDQLLAIREAVMNARQAGFLEHMFEDPFDLRAQKRMGATVDEFQGSEADVVIVSLVRNNALIPWKSVGFLKEANRMNVLLSRARQKLIVVGSWDFFASRCDEFTSPDEEYAYIGRMMEHFGRAERAGYLARVKTPQ
jgi:serine/threonine protein kinase/DNA polymerase III delta prime subunit